MTRLFVERYGLKWRLEETVETVNHVSPAEFTPLKQGVNEKPQAP